MATPQNLQSREATEKQYLERYAKLNTSQKKAVDSIEGPLLVVAGPGSGKTEILSLRVANIRRQTQVLPSNILCLTFTEYAALNMRDRLSKLIGEDAYHVSIHTFHNFCVDVIQRYPEFFYGSASFAPADDLGKIALLEDIFKDLSFDDPLRSIHPEQGFVFLKPVMDAIGDLKSAGITPDEFEEIVKHNQKSAAAISAILAPVMDKTVSKKILPDVEALVGELETLAKKEIKSNSFPSKFFHPLVEVVAVSLKQALDDANEADAATPISKWKEKWMKKTDEGARVLKDEINAQKLLSLAHIYRAYREVMHKEGLYDFNDMILDVISAMQAYPRLRFELQEQYQYLLVDEFQDTNDAQMRLLRLIAEAEVNEGRPNIMVVGDDDQAIYKFQGAELSNILDFRSLYQDVGVITMTDNYRSTQDILDLSSSVIRKGSNRLENLIPELNKTLVARKEVPKLEASSIIYKNFPTSLHQFHFVSREIRRLLDAGHEPEEIAIISRKHRQLVGIVPYLQGVKVPLRYEREQNVFEEPHIRQLITLARFVASINQKKHDEADDLLPEILSFPFWNLDRKDIWKISLDASKEYGKKWIEVMLEYKDGKNSATIRNIAEFLLEVGTRASSEPLEKVLDMLIGAHTVLLAESEDDETDDPETVSALTKDGAFTSPFKDFYFNKERFEHARAEYLGFLSSLRVFVQALREYKNGKMLSIQDLVEFVDVHEKNELPLNDKSPFASVHQAVNLLSAHKAKGLEFKTVFVLSCQDDVWAGRGRPTKIAMPSNLPIQKAGDDEDDHLRLFYVALTRAKDQVYLTSYDLDDDGSISTPLRFLSDFITNQPAAIDATEHSTLDKTLGAGSDKDSMPETSEVLTASWLTYHTPPFFGAEQKLLESVLDGYQLSVTHLNNFLNVIDGGPQKFLEENMLRFPHAKTLSSSYGSAIHSALEDFSIAIRSNEKLSNSEKKKKDEIGEELLLSLFENALRKERMAPTDYKTYLDRGKSALKNFYEVKKSQFTSTDKTEVSFKREGVLIGKAHLNGKIDRMVDLVDSMGRGFVAVHDYKTGKAYQDWEGGDANQKARLYAYKRQLLFYKLLVENSKSYRGVYKVARGVLEFVEPVKGTSKKPQLAELITNYEEEDMQRFSRLVEAVYKKIMALDFPDITNYSKDLKGIIQFEDDLLAQS